MKPTTRSYLLLLALAVIYDSLFTLPPILIHFGINADLFYKFFQPVCHQMDERSFHVFGYKLAVCSRCSSLYYGLTLGIALYPLFKSLDNIEIPSLTFLVIPSIALAVDFSVNYLDIARNNFVSRSITGGALGISTAFFLVPIWISLMKEFSRLPAVDVKSKRTSAK
ncbi:MAG: DUF2085 domain-containing protein [Candidatus Kryptoniota bacterium]